jgi:arsenate reductase
MTTAKLRSLLKKLGIPAFGLLRTKEPQFKELGLSESTPESQVLHAIVANPGLLNRPIVEVGDRAVIARPIEKALELIRSAG